MRGKKWPNNSQVSPEPVPPSPCRLCTTMDKRLAGDGPWDRPVSVAVVGDLGLVNAGATFDRLHQLVEDEEVDFVLHLGDIACE